MYAPSYLMGDSRVRSLETENLPISKIWSLPGAKIYDLYEVIDGELAEITDDADEPPLVYVSVGICDLTHRYKRMFEGNRIDEVIVLPKESHAEIVQTAQSALQDVQRFIYSHGAIPVLSTIYPMAIGDWNAQRLNKGKTYTLTKAAEYDDMQSNLEDMCDSVNSEIINLNRQNKVKTPLLHKCLEHNRGRSRKTTIKYNLLCDGCHPTPKLAKDIAKCLAKTIALNKQHINLDN